MPTDYNATVTFRADLTPGTMVLRVKLDGEPFPFEPGQYTVLGLRRSSHRIGDAAPDSPELRKKPHDFMIRRAYSITSNSTDDELEFVITLVRSGDLTPRLFALREGSRVYMEPRASGLFTLDTSSGVRDVLMVATGSALAPYMAMIRSGMPDSEDHQFVILHGAAVSWDLAFRAQMEELAALSGQVTYVPVVAEPERDGTWQGLTGTLQEAIRSGELEDRVGIPLSPDRFDVYLAGNPQVIDEVTEQLRAEGFQTGDPRDPATNVHVEKYW